MHYAGMRKKKKKRERDEKDQKRKKGGRRTKGKDEKKKADHLDVGHEKDVTTIRVGNYQMVEAIGKGGFGTVYRALNLKTGATVAVKRVSLHGIPHEELEGLEMEIKLLKNLQNKNIVKYVDAVRSDEFLNIVLEYVENGSLSNMMSMLLRRGHVEEQLVAVYTAQILAGLKYLHQQGVIHRDIKGANILATKDGVVKLADFGVATKLNDTKKSDSVVGTPYWMAPEIIEMTGQQSAACDIWSVGCTVIELLTGKPPYFDLQQMPALFRIVQDDHPPLPDNISPALEDFLMECFKKDPLQRVDAAALQKHPWLRQAMEMAGNGLQPSPAPTLRDLSAEEVLPPVKEVPKKPVSPPPKPSSAKPSSHVANALSMEEDIFANMSDDEDDVIQPTRTAKGSIAVMGTVAAAPAGSGVNMDMIGNARIERAWVEDEEDDDFGADLDDDDINLNILNQRKEQAAAGKGGAEDEEEVDVFADLEFDAPDPRSDQDAKFTKTFMKTIAKLVAREEEETIIRACDQLQAMFHSNPELTKTLMTQHGVIPVMEMLEVFHTSIIVAVLKLVNLVIGNDLKFQQNMSLVGLIPAIIKFASPGFPANIRLEAANFVRHFSYSSDFTRKMFIACGGLPVLVGFLEENYTESKTLVFNSIDCIRHVFEITSNPKNDFCRLFRKYGLLAPLARALVHVNNDKEHPDAAEYTLKIANTLQLFSNGDSHVKTSMAKPQVMEPLLKALPAFPHNVLNLVLKSIRNISMEPTTLDLLESAGAIPALVPFLSSPYKDVQTQVLLAMFYLSAINQTRREQAARAGLIPHLQRFIRTNNPLKQFAFPIIFRMAKGTRATLMELKKYDGVSFFVSLLEDRYWRTQALDSIAVWLNVDPRRVEFVLSKTSNINRLIAVFKKTTGPVQLELLTSFVKVLSSTAINRALGRSHAFIQELIARLQIHESNNSIRKQLLKMLTALYDQHMSKRQFVERHQLVPVLEAVAKDKSSVIIAPMATVLLERIQADK